MIKWYAVAYRKVANPDDSVWTLSTNPDETGWETDMGFDGYGLTKADAEFLAEAANEKIARESQSS